MNEYLVGKRNKEYFLCHNPGTLIVYKHVDCGDVEQLFVKTTFVPRMCKTCGNRSDEYHGKYCLLPWPSPDGKDSHIWESTFYEDAVFPQLSKNLMYIFGGEDDR